MKYHIERGHDIEIEADGDVVKFSCQSAYYVAYAIPNS